MKLQNITWAYLLLILIPCITIFIAAHYAEASTHLWPLAVIHFDEPAPETASFKMTEGEFRNEQSALELRVTCAYNELLASLTNEQRILLKTAQSAWRNYFEKYERALKEQLDEPVKVFYGIKGDERKTNVYRDTVLEVLEHRAMDLESWSQGRYGYLELAALEEAEKRLSRKMNLFDEAFGTNIYIMDEIVRAPMQEAQDSWYAYFRSNMEFVKEVTKNNEAAKIAEELIQVQRMYILTLLHKEGYVFFHREREE